MDKYDVKGNNYSSKGKHLSLPAVVGPHSIV